MQTSGVFAALSDGQRKMIVDFLKEGMGELSPTHPKLFNQRSTTHKFERIQSVAAFQDVPLKPEGAEYEFDIIQPGYSKDITPLEYGLGFIHTETASEDDDEAVLAQKSKYLGFSMRVLQETQAANVFINGFTTQLTADGESLFDTGHLLKRGGTAKNRLSVDSDLSVASLRQMRSDMRTNTKLESGQLVKPASSVYLVHHPDNEWLAYQLCKAKGLPQTDLNDPNPIDGTMDIEPLTWEYLSDPDAFFLVAKKSSAHGLIQLNRVKPKLNPERQQAETGNLIISIRSRQHWDSFDWRNTAGTPGA
jgi:hypothetical protein